MFTVYTSETHLPSECSG